VVAPQQRTPARRPVLVEMDHRRLRQRPRRTPAVQPAPLYGRSPETQRTLPELFGRPQPTWTLPAPILPAPSPRGARGRCRRPRLRHLPQSSLIASSWSSGRTAGAGFPDTGRPYTCRRPMRRTLATAAGYAEAACSPTSRRGWRDRQFTAGHSVPGLRKRVRSPRTVDGLPDTAASEHLPCADTHDDHRICGLRLWPVPKSRPPVHVLRSRGQTPGPRRGSAILGTAPSSLYVALDLAPRRQQQPASPVRALACHTDHLACIGQWRRLPEGAVHRLTHRHSGHRRGRGSNAPARSWSHAWGVDSVQF
jgi:hypothetical protein